MVSNIQRNIVKEILRECFSRKLKPNENFVGYFVKLLLMDPNWGITDNFMNSRTNVQKFVKYVIGQLQAQRDPKIVTLKMQFYFTCNLELMENVTEMTRQSLRNRLAPLKTEIFKATELKYGEDVDNMRKKIVYYITLIFGLGNPVNETVYIEALTAFKSIMSDDELKEFAKCQTSLKDSQLERMAKLICGIRLFNKDCGKGGAGIADLPGLLDRAIGVIKEDVQAALMTAMGKVNSLTTAVDKCYVLKATENKYKMECRLPPDVDQSYMEYTKDLLILFRQYELFIRKIIEELEKLEQSNANIFQNFDHLLRKTHKTIQMRIAVPVNVVFPLFEEFAKLWTQLQNQVIVLSKLNNVLVNLDSFAKTPVFNNSLIEAMLQERNAHSDAERLEETAKCAIRSENEKVQIFKLENFQNIDKVRIQYLGFCIWKLVETDGALIPGNPTMGVAKYRNMNFVFSIPEASMGFSRKPDEYINHVLNLGRRKPQLINFLLLKDQLQQVSDVGQLVAAQEIEKITKDKEVQLEKSYHFSFHIDATYKWNMWDLKREALLLANYSKCKTVSTQTWKSHSTNCIRSQTYEHVEKGLQTKKDNYSNVPKPLNYIFGLRGRTDDKQFIVDITPTDMK